jgi:hypothetical protein
VAAWPRRGAGGPGRSGPPRMGGWVGRSSRPGKIKRDLTNLVSMAWERSQISEWSHALHIDLRCTSIPSILLVLTRSSGHKCQVSQFRPMHASDNSLRHPGASGKLRRQVFATIAPVQPKIQGFDLRFAPPRVNLFCSGPLCSLLLNLQARVNIILQLGIKARGRWEESWFAAVFFVRPHIYKAINLRFIYHTKIIYIHISQMCRGRRRNSWLWIQVANLSPIRGRKAHREDSYAPTKRGKCDVQTTSRAHVRTYNLQVLYIQK